MPGGREGVGWVVVPSSHHVYPYTPESQKLRHPKYLKKLLKFFEVKLLFQIFHSLHCPAVDSGWLLESFHPRFATAAVARIPDVFSFNARIKAHVATGDMQGHRGRSQNWASCWRLDMSKGGRHEELIYSIYT